MECAVTRLAAVERRPGAVEERHRSSRLKSDPSRAVFRAHAPHDSALARGHGRHDSGLGHHGHSELCPGRGRGRGRGLSWEIQVDIRRGTAINDRYKVIGLIGERTVGMTCAPT